MKCKHCQKEIVLIPSAAERAKKFGGTPEDYTNLFQYHAPCALEVSAKGAADLIARIKAKGQS